MKALDRFIQRLRIAKAAPWIAPDSRVLDIGCADGALFRQLRARIREGVGIDSELRERVAGENYELLPGTFPEALEDGGLFDAITLLAVLEHVPPEQQAPLARACARRLAPGGHLVVTAPAPLVDRILDVLLFLRLIDGMALGQHYGFEPAQTPAIFEPHGFALVHARRFQLGLNHLFVFRRQPA
jgi:2-polyprenyl-3-methyl-5-hydroxy-6-metoxy-1,4-benzoquinol methylase